MVDISWVIANVLFVLCGLVWLVLGLWLPEIFAGKIANLLGCVVIIGGLLVVNNFPFDMAYHSYRPVSGTVDNIASRLVDTGNHSAETKYVVKFTGNPQLYGCLDTRCAIAKHGDHLELLCERQWQYASVGGYDCNYNQ